MEIKIIQIGDLFAESEVDKIGYYSDFYFLDADIIVLDIEAVMYEFEEFFETTSINHISVRAMRLDRYLLWKKRIEERKEELSRYLKNGGNLFVLNALSAQLEFNLLQADDTVIKEKIDLLHLALLNSDCFNFKKVTGSSLLFAKPFDALNEFHCSYNGVYLEYLGYPVSYLTKTKEVTGVCVNYMKGNIILLPRVVLAAHDYQEFQYLSAKLKIALQLLDVELKMADDKERVEIQMPKWASQLFIGNEEAEKKQLDIYLREKSQLEQLIRQQERKLHPYRELKTLLWASGNLLEVAVEKY